MVRRLYCGRFNKLRFICNLSSYCIRLYPYSGFTSSIPAFVRFVSSHCRHRPDPLLYLQHGYRLIHYGGDRLFMRPLDSLKVRWCQSLILTMPATRGCEPFLCASWRRSQLVFLCCPFTCSPARPCWVYVTELQSQIKTVTRLTHALMSVQDSHALVWMREGQDGMGVGLARIRPTQAASVQLAKRQDKGR